jgi:hypothetical protein
MEDTEVECEFCNDTGFVRDIEYNEDIHTYQDAGLIECKHPHNYGDNPGVNEGA